jgi:hypothetical protein
MIMHPTGKPLGTALVIAKGAVGGISDPPHLIFTYVAKLRDFCSCKKEPRVIACDLKKLLLIEVHGVLHSSGNVSF